MSKLERLEALEKEIEQLKQECNVEYPIYCKHIKSSLIIKFTDINTGFVLIPDGIWSMGKESDNFIAHFKTSVWEELAYDEEKGLYDKQVVWCWNDEIFGGQLRFYDAINKCVFHPKSGFRGNGGWDNYEAVKPSQIPQFMLNAYNKLED